LCEWQKQERHKQPYHIRLRDGLPFAFGGLWEHWEGEETAVNSCTLLTTTPNDVMRSLHYRMPVILPPAVFVQWLDPSGQDIERLQAMLRPYPGEDLIARQPADQSAHLRQARVHRPARLAPPLATPA
jgi:putative SOS response-associated peptidase YedK